MHEEILIASMGLIWLLKVFILIYMFRLRVGAIKRREVKISSFSTYENEHEQPKRLLQASRNYKNLFEAPTLFYAVALLVIVLGLGDMVTSVLAITFALSRVVHSIIHIGSNNIIHRMYAFAVGIFAVHILWIYTLGNYFL
ncbi:MAG: MAPEG family protein [Bacteriovoracaceae bacterium]|nr:MAPEG family protein [Bacteriovoracaceae bacterium]